MFRIAAFALAVLCLGSSARAEVPDATTYLSNNPPILVLSIDVEQLLKGKPTKHLLGDKKADAFLMPVFEKLMDRKDSGEGAFIARLFSEANHATIAVMLFGTNTVVLEGSYDAPQVLKDARALAKANNLDVTATKVGDHEVVRVGEIAFAVLNKSQLVLCNSPPPGAKPKFLEPTPGAAEEVVKEAIARATNKSKPKPHESLAALLPKLSKKEPIAFILHDPEAPMMGFVRFQGDDFLVGVEKSFPDVKKAQEVESDWAAMGKGQKEKSDDPLASALKTGKVSRNEKTVRFEFSVPADVVKKMLADWMAPPKK